MRLSSTAVPQGRETTPMLDLIIYAVVIVGMALVGWSDRWQPFQPDPKTTKKEKHGARN